MISSRLAVAVHILVYLAWRRDVPVASPELAKSVNTNAVVVRRITSALRRAGLVSVQTGVQGGARLVRPPGEITLLEVYRAVHDDGLFAARSRAPCPDCGVGSNIEDVLDTVFSEAQAAMEGVLDAVTVEAIWRDVEDRILTAAGAAR